VSFLLDTNICSEHLKRPTGLMHRFVQYSGRLFVPTIVVGELHAWAYMRRADPLGLIARIENDLLTDLTILDYDKPCAGEFGRLRGTLLRQGVTIGRLDSMIASVALVHDLTLVTHNTKDFENIPDLRVEDWLM
jgi:tRNA(fMet)-specific endonuclease VapC